MNLPDPLERRLLDYLDKVRRALADRPAALREAIAADLERQIRDAVAERAEDRAPNEGDLDAVLENMDPAEAFAAPLDETAAAPARRFSNRWFFVALAFLLVNAWGVWRWTSRSGATGAVWAREFAPGNDATVEGAAPLRWRFSAPMVAAEEVGRAPAEPPARLNPPVAGRFVWRSERELVFTPDDSWPLCREFDAQLDDALADRRGRPVGGERAFRFTTPPLQFLRAEQAGAGDGAVTLRLIFNAAPNVGALARYLTIRRAGRPEALPFRLLGGAVSRDVLVAVHTSAEEELDIKIEAGAPPHVGTRGLAETTSRRLRVSSRLELTRLEPVVPPFEAPSLNAYFSVAPDPIAAAEFIRLDPAIPFRVRPLQSWRGAGLTIEADFEPGAPCTVRFLAGLRAARGPALESDIARHVQFADRSPSIAFSDDGRYLSPAGPLIVPLSTVNVEACDVKLARVLPENLVFFAMRQSNRYERSYSYARGADHERLTEPLATRARAVAGAPNRVASLRLDLREWLAEAPGGAYIVTASAKKAGVAEKLVVVTDLGLAAKAHREGVFVWVTSLREGRPLSGVRVALLAENNRELAAGETDEDGVARLAARMDDPDAIPFLLVARRGADLSYLKLDGAALDTGAPAGARPFLAAGHEAYVFTDRGIFRPGETLRVKAIVRDRALAAPAPFPVALRIIRPDGRLHREWPALLSDYGTAEWSEVWPADLPLGRYRIELRTPGAETAMGATSVLLEEYAPPQIAGELRVPEGRAMSGATLDFSVYARHLFGRPAAGLPARARVTIEPVPFAPEAWRDWRFGDNEKTFAPTTRELDARTLDADGAAAWQFPLDARWRPPAALRATLSATVMERSGRAVTFWATRAADPYPFYIGLRPAFEGGSLEIGREYAVAVAAVAPDGAATADVANLDVELYRVDWTTLLRRRADGQWAYETVRTLQSLNRAGIALTGGRGETRFTPERVGSYLLAVRDAASGASSSVEFYAAAPGAAWVGWAMQRPDRVEIALDKERYLPGETARATLKAPFGGVALVTLESDRVLSHRLLPLNGNTAEFELPVTEEMRPNAYLAVSVIRPVTPAAIWTAHRAAGAALLRVDQPTRRLAVEIEAPADIRPQSRLEAAVRARAADGAPAAGAEVVVAAVDEGICSLTAFRTPDPMAWFLEARRLGVQLFDVYGQLLPLLEEQIGGPDSHAPGDAPDAALARRLNPIRAHRFRPTALWSGTVRADEAGIARVAFDVPEFTGELRLMAVAVTREAAGSAARATAVKRPLVVQPSLPRFLAPGDRCFMPIEIFNETGAAAGVRLAVAAEGPLSVGAFDAAFDLPAGGARTVRVPLTAGAAPGVAKCRVSAVSDAERYEETFELAVRPPAPPTVVVREGALAEGESVELAPPAGALPGTAYVEVWCGAQPEIALGGALDQLLRYPYGCLEQTVSSAFPLLYLSDLAERVRPGALGGMETGHFLRAGLWRLLGMQQAGGGFSLWPHAEEYAWGSIYAAHFLVEAGRAGVEVPADRRDAALDYLRELLRRPAPEEATPKAGAWADDMARRAYACHVLALAKRPDAAWNERLLAMADRLGPAGRAHLAAALMLSGRPRDAAALLERAAEIPDAAPRDGGGNLNSAARDLALELAARVELNPADPRAAQLALRLSGLRVGGAWHTTQENAVALMALGKYYRAQPNRPAPFTAALRFGGRELAFSNARPFRWQGPADSAPPPRLENRGPGAYFYFGRIESVPADGRMEESDRGLRVRRELLDLEGRPLERARWAQGDVAVVRIRLDTLDAAHDNLAIEDLLPAGLEIENPALATSENTPWLRDRNDWVRHRDLRDDRLILFTGPVAGRHAFHYTVRAVTPGRFVWPAARASAMYDPAIRSAHGGGTLEVE